MNDVGHLFMCLFAIDVSFLMDLLFKCLSIVFTGLYVFLLTLRVCYIFRISGLLDFFYNEMGLLFNFDSYAWSYYSER